MRPTLMLLIGISGSGKSTFAQKLLKPDTVYLSSDKIREELWGDEAIQGDNNEVFSLMQQRAIDALNNGMNVIYDATNLTRKDRACIISKCPKFVEIEAYVIWAPIEVCIERDTARERTVGKEVIDRMLKRFQAPYYDEDIDEIYVECTVDNFDGTKYTHKIMSSMKIPHDNPHHTLSIYEHCMEAHRYAYKMGYDDNIEFAAMWHDIGKPYVKAFVDSRGNSCDTAHYYSHQNLSAYIAYGINNSTPFRAWLVGTHMEPFFNTKYYKGLPVFLKNYIDFLHKCDVEAH